MKSFLKSLKTFFESKTELDKGIEDRFLTNFKKEFAQDRETIWSSLKVRSAVAASLLFVATLGYMNSYEEDLSPQSMTSLQILENEAMLVNMDVLEELEEFEELTEEDWEVLVGEIN